MRKKPFRPSNEISQSYNSGTVKIYAVTNSAPAGYQPRNNLELKYTLQFEERALGLTRIYQSKQAQAEILRVLRVPRVNISPQDVAIIHNGQAYEISTAQLVVGIYPPSLDISLKKLTHDLEALANEMV